MDEWNGWLDPPHGLEKVLVWPHLRSLAYDNFGHALAPVWTPLLSPNLEPFGWSRGEFPHRRRWMAAFIAAVGEETPSGQGSHLWRRLAAVPTKFGPIKRGGSREFHPSFKSASSACWLRLGLTWWYISVTGVSAEKKAKPYFAILDCIALVEKIGLTENSCAAALIKRMRRKRVKIKMETLI